MKKLRFLIPTIFLLFASLECAAYAFDEDVTVRLAYRTKDGLGYDNNYATLGLFYTPSALFSNASCFSNFQPLVDVRSHYIQSSHYASNVGIGLRTLLTDQAIVGANVFYDYRNSSVSCYDQVGVGGELLNCFLDVRVNGYFPVSDRTRCSSPSTFLYTGGFFASRRFKEHAYRNVDLEFGKAFNGLPFTPYLAVGTYYLDSRRTRNTGITHNTRAVGTRWRVMSKFWDFLTLEVNGSYDPIFKGRYQFYAAVDFALFSLCCNTLKEFFECTPCRTCFEDRMRERIYRNELIILKKKCFWTTNY